MTKSKKILMFFAILFLSSQTYAKSKTSFDDRPICEENKGVWREFGNSCANSCEEQFDEYAICGKETIFACDCGEKSCWHENKCIKITEYEKIFAELKKEKEEQSQAIKKEREERIKTDPALAYYMQNLYRKEQEKQEAQNAKASGNKPSQQNQQPQAPSAQIASQPIAASQAQIASQPQQRIPPGFSPQQNQNNPPDLVFPVVEIPK